MTSCPDKSPGRLPGARAEKDRGAALVLVLWFTVLFSLIAVSVARLGQTDAKIAINMEQAAKAEALADGGVYLAIDALLGPQPSFETWPHDASVKGFMLGDGRVEVAVSDEALKLNPGFASIEVVETALADLGFPAARAAAHADAIDQARAEGLRERQGARGSAPEGSAQPFGTLRDLQAVTGMSDDEYARVRQVFSLRAPTQQARQDRLPDAAPPLANRRVRGPYGISVTATLPAGGTATRYAVVNIQTRGAGGWEILEWD